MHLAGHMRPAGRVFETPDLEVTQILRIFRKSFVNLNPGLDSTYADTTENAESLRVEEENL